MKTVRDPLIALCAVSGISRLYRAQVRRRGPLIRVLLFHDVQDSKRFFDALVFLKEHYHIVSAEEYFNSKLDACRINILVTFDDGYASWTDVCLPVLSSLDIKGLFFVSSGLLDVHDDAVEQNRYVKEKLLSSPRRTLSWEALRALHQAGHVVGGHTRTHTRLPLLPEAEQLSEIAADKERIETMLDTTIHAFSYPFGEFTSSTEQLVRAAGYSHAFSTEARFANQRIGARIPRLCVEESMSSVALRRWIDGGYDVWDAVKRSLRGEQRACTDRAISLPVRNFP